MARIGKGMGMTSAERLIAGVLLGSLTLFLSQHRETGGDGDDERQAWTGRLLIWWFAGATSLEHVASLRGFAFHMMLIIGACETGRWLAMASDAVLPWRKEAPDGHGWSFATDRWGCALALVAGVAAMVVVFM